MDWWNLQWQYELSVVGRLVLAALLGAGFGFEREIHGRPAGIRTHLLVTLGACLMMIVSEHFFFKYQDFSNVSVLRLDPGRVASQIVTGIGFLGAGAIIKDGVSVRGLTTAACLWVAAGVGMAAGVGLYIAALVVTALAIGSLMLLKQVEDRLAKDRYASLTVYCDDRKGSRNRLEEFLRNHGLRVVDFSVEKDLGAGEVRYDFVIARFGEDYVDTLAEQVATLGGVRKVRLR
jgi:putative Mg2+ transporter-C (MgtC) family protein